MVPPHIRHWRDVCSNATNWLVCVLLFIGIVCLTCMFLFRNVVSHRPISGQTNADYDVYIGQSEVAMWMRVVSGWVCMVLYMWSLLAPVFIPDRWVWVKFVFPLNYRKWLGFDLYSNYIVPLLISLFGCKLGKIYYFRKSLFGICRFLSKMSSGGYF